MKSSGPNAPRRWQKLAVRPVVRTPIFELQSVAFQHPLHPDPRDFSVINAPDWVNVVAVTPAQELVLVRQFRYGIDDFSLEIPGGMVDPGENPLAAGLRELREETGFTAGSARLLGSVHPNPALLNNRCHFILALEAVRTAELDWDENEEMEVSLRPVDEVYALAQAGHISHGLVLNALQFFSPVWTDLKGGRAV